jgi:ribosome-interacting GTPase 1
MAKKVFEQREPRPDNMTADMKRKSLEMALKRAHERKASAEHIAKIKAQLDTLKAEMAEAEKPASAKPF